MVRYELIIINTDALMIIHNTIKRFIFLPSFLLRTYLQ